MTTLSFSDKAEDRDTDFVVGLCSAARVVRKEFRDWIQEEVIAMCTECDTYIPLIEGTIGTELARLSQRLRDINMHDLPRADGDFADTINEVASGGYDDPDDAHRRLDESSYGLLQLVKELQLARPMIAGLAGR